MFQDTMTSFVHIHLWINSNFECFQTPCVELKFIIHVLPVGRAWTEDKDAAEIRYIYIYTCVHAHSHYDAW